MSKYIRTKDGRIIDTETYLDKCWVKQNQGGTCKWETFGTGCGACRFNELNKVDIIKQADTIEELCDCYSYETETTRDYLVAKSWKQADKSRNIYGCILTDKGIIRVAEMNDTGKLELL